MLIIGITHKQISCLWTCLKGIEGCAEILDLPYQEIDFSDLQTRNFQGTSEECIIIFEIGFPHHAGISLNEIKQYFPNSKLVGLSADAYYFMHVEKRPQVDYSKLDLVLEVDDRCIDWIRAFGTPTDKWHWTISQWMIDYITCYKKRSILPDKEYDFLCLVNPDSLNSGYRKEIKDYIENNNFIFTQGGGGHGGHYDNDIDSILRNYFKSKFILGTTSHAHPQIDFGLKGFRDALAPFTNSLLIYNDNPQVKSFYRSIVPYYREFEFSDLIDIYNKYTSYPEGEYFRLRNLQVEFFTQNTIDKQLVALLCKHGLI